MSVADTDPAAGRPDAPPWPEDVLARWYDGPVQRAGRTHPTVVHPLASDTRVVVEPVDADLDTELLEGGHPHLGRLRSASPRMHDGPLVVFVDADGGVVRCRRSGYFAMVATCDAVRAELVGAGAAAGTDALPLRRRAHEVAGDPLASGTGRAAAIGVSVVLTVPGEQGRSALVGRRSSRVAIDPGMWHVAPSGMLEPSPGDAVAATVATELAEEVGVRLAREDVASRLTVLGLAHDLLRLRPDLCVRLDLRADEAPPTGALPRDGEFDEMSQVLLTPEGLDHFWTRHPPGALTPAAAGALALTEVGNAPAPGDP
ncbi:MAG: NUDIX domain-containing protein [Actinomycetota bacterium]|nr:NUDIX domain-containing protein [Actinomycetota bacterium]